MKRLTQISMIGMYEIIVESVIRSFSSSDLPEVESHLANNLHNRVDQAVAKRYVFMYWYL